MHFMQKCWVIEILKIFQPIILCENDFPRVLQEARFHNLKLMLKMKRKTKKMFINTTMNNFHIISDEEFDEFD